MRVKGIFFCLLSGLVLFSAINSVCADEDEVDDLLDECEIASDPKPSVMVYDYELSPETLMPGDVGVLTITLKNMQEEPIEREIDIKVGIVGNYTTVEETTKEIERTSGSVGPTWEHTIEEKVEPVTQTIDIDTKTRFTMDAYIKEAYLAERDFKVYNRYLSAGVIGPDRKADLAFKIKAPLEEGIYMLKFIADIEDMEGKSSKGIRYFIPVTITGTVNILPLEVSQNEVELEVINEGLSDVDSVYVTVSNMSGAECQPEKVYIGKIKSGESATAVFNVNKAGGKERMESAVLSFKAVYKNGINKHESDIVCVRMPCSADEEKEEEEEKEKGESLLEERSENSFNALTATAAPVPASFSSLTLAVFTFAGAALLVPGILYLFLSKRKGKGKGKSKGKGKGKGKGNGER